MFSRSSRTAALLAAAATLAASAAVLAPSAPAAPGAPSAAPSACTPDGRQLRGPEAVRALDAAVAAGRLTAAAARQAREQMAADEHVLVDSCGVPLIFDQIPTTPDPDVDRSPGMDPQDIALSAAVVAAAGTDPFSLQSRPGSSRVVYLDFRGGETTGTAWNNSYGTTITTTAFDLDGAPASTSESEATVIRSIWARVAEDYAAFDVNVTTADPGADALLRADWNDNAFGMTAQIGVTPSIGDACGCGGVAYVGVYSYPGSTYHPAWVFTNKLGNDGKNIAEATSHEIGHTLGLYHDGTPSVGYYTGADGWAPIMGVGYYQPLSQWSRGEYANANNTQDDLAVIQSNGLPLVPDDHGGTAATASSVALNTATTQMASVSGVVGVSDTDMFTVTTPVAATFTAAPVAPGANLDATLTVMTAAGSPLATLDPASAYVGRDAMSGLSAAVTVSAGTYVVAVSGTGRGSAYTAYGSQGAYTLTVDKSATDPAATLAIGSTLPSGAINQSYSTQLSATGGSGSYAWAMVPVDGWTLSSSGGLSGIPADTTTTFTVAVVDTVTARLRTQTLTVTSTGTPGAPLAVTSALSPGGTLRVAYTGQMSATGGKAPYSYSMVPVTGWTLSSSGVLYGIPAATPLTFTVTVTDAAGSTATGPVTLTSLAAPTVKLSPSVWLLVQGTQVGSAAVVGSGGKAPYTYSIASGALPSGLTLASSGTVSGTPTLAGSYKATFKVTDSEGRVGQLAATLSVKAPLSISTLSPLTMTAGRSTTAKLTATGAVSPYTWSLVSGTLPPGVALSTAGAFSGTPTVSGSYPLQVRVSASYGGSVTKAITVSVVEPPPVTVTAATYGTLTAGKSVSIKLSATGGIAPYTWAVSSGSLPTGMTLSSTGTISGTPTVAGTFTPTIRVTAVRGTPGTIQLSITVVEPPPVAISAPATVSAARGMSVSVLMAATGGVAPYSWSIASGSLPPGLALSGSKISGVPTTAGTYTVTVKCTSLRGFATKSITFTIS